MYGLYLNEEQLNNLLQLLDRELKANGLQSLAMVVDLHNALAGVQKVEESKERAQEEVRPTE